jgi:Tfp pilus assembly protein PilF
MSGTLNLFDRLLALGRNYQQLQQHREALHYLGRLAAFHDLPPEVAEEAQVSLAEIYLRRRQYRRARRHLTVALLYRPDNARYHYLMARALAKGRRADPERAAAHYEKSLELDAEQPRCLADFGLLCLRLDRTEEGLGALARAVDLTANDPATVAKLAKGLCRAGRVEEAQSVLRAARFRNPHEGRFRQLYNDFLFRRLREAQAATRKDSEALLPFARQDDAEPLPGPHRHRLKRRSDWKHG